MARIAPVHPSAFLDLTGACRVIVHVGEVIELTGGLQLPIGVAIVGAGYWGSNLIRTLRQTAELRLEVVCDLNINHARRMLGESTAWATDSFDQVLADPNVRAVVVATPPTTHFPIAMRALAAGKHVLVEKPLATSYLQGAQLSHVAESRQLVLMVDHTYCYTPALGILRSMVRDGEIGELAYMTSERRNVGMPQSDVDVLWELAPHDFSILDAILPDDIVPISVIAEGSDPLGAGADSVVHVTIELSNGAQGHVYVSWLASSKVRRVVIGGSVRTVIWDDLTPGRELTIWTRPVQLATRAGQQTPAEIHYDHPARKIVQTLPEQEALRNVMTEFAGSIHERRPPLTGGLAGLRVLSLLEAASTSLRNGSIAVPLGPWTIDNALRTT